MNRIVGFLTIIFYIKKGRNSTIFAKNINQSKKVWYNDKTKAERGKHFWKKT